MLPHQIPRRVLVHLTAGRWSWKLKSDNECVTTHLPNPPAPKMDGAQACDPYSIIVVTRCRNESAGREGCHEALGASVGKTALGTDLGRRSNFSNESFEDRCGEGFHVNSFTSNRQHN